MSDPQAQIIAAIDREIMAKRATMEAEAAEVLETLLGCYRTIYDRAAFLLAAGLSAQDIHSALDEAFKEIPDDYKRDHSDDCTGLLREAVDYAAAGRPPRPVPDVGWLPLSVQAALITGIRA